MDVCCMKNKYSNFNPERNITHAKRWGEPKALLYEVREANLRQSIKELLCDQFFQVKSKFLQQNKSYTASNDD